MRIKLKRPLHGTYGSLRGIVDLEDQNYAKKLIQQNKAEPAEPSKDEVVVAKSTKRKTQPKKPDV